MNKKLIAWFICSYIILVLIVSVPWNLFNNLIGINVNYYDAITFQHSLNHLPLQIICIILSGVLHVLLIISNWIFMVFQEPLIDFVTTKLFKKQLIK